MAASLRDPHLRAPLVSQEEAAAIDAQGMSTLRRGYEAGRIGTDINARLAEESALRAAGDVAAADALRTNLAPRQARQGIYAPAVHQVEQIGGAGDAASWFAGQVGQGFASMQDPLMASAAVGAVGTGLGFVPNPIAKGAGMLLRNVVAPVAGYDITRTQLKGEQYGNLSDDPTVMARFSPQEIDSQASTYGNVAGLMDTLLPGVVGRQIGGAALRGAARPLLAPVPKAALGVVGEGATEVGQGELGRYMHAGLNPERDTSEDASARLNEALGGAAGGAGVAGIGAGAEALYRAGRQAPGAVTDAAGSVIGLAEDGLAKAKGFGKGKPVPLGDDLRAASAEKDDARLADAQLLRGEPPADLDVNDPAAFDQWFHQSFPQRRERVRQGLQELAGQGDQEAGSLLAGLDAPDNAQVDAAITAGAERIMDAQGLKDLLAEAESREAARKAPAARVGDALGKGLGWMGRQAAAAGKAAWDGATGGRKLNAQAPWTSDEFESRRREALSAFDEAADVAKRRQTGELLSEYLAEQARARASRFGSEDNAQRVTGLMRETGRQVADLAANWNRGDRTAGERFDRLRYDLGRVADRMVGAYGDRSIEVAQRLEKLAGPEAAPVFKHLLEEIEQARQQGTARRAAQREQTAFDTLSKGIDPQRRAELLRNGIDLDAPRVRSKMLRLVEAAAEGTLPPAQRQELVDLVGQENLQRVMDSFTPATAEGEAQTMLEEAYTKPARDGDGNVLTSEDTAGSDETETSDFEARQAEKLVQGRAGASLYGFYGMNNVRTDRTLGGKTRDPTAFSKDHRPRLLDLRVAAGQDATATPETLAARTEAIEKTKQRLRKHLGIDENDEGAGEWNIEVRSLLDDMARRDGVSLQTVLGPLAGRNEAANTDAAVAGGTARRQAAAAGLKERVSGALPGQRSADMLDQIVATTGRSVGEPRSDADAQSERLGIDPTFVNKVITRYRDFMRSELERAQNSTKEGAAARVKAFEARVKAATAVLEDRRRQANSLRDPAGKQPELQTTAEQREKLTRMAVTYLKNFGVVVAERGTNADLETLTADQVLQLAASGDKLHKALDASTDKNDLIVFESKLAPTKKDAGPGLLRMRGRDLVALSKKAAQEMTAPVEGAKQPKAKSPQQTWLDHLSNGIAIVVASGQVAGLPRGFENGKIPDHIPLPPTKDGKPMTAGKLRWMKEQRAKEGVGQPLSKYSKEAGTPKAEAAVAKDQAGGREIMGGDAVRQSSDERSTRADIVPSERPADKAGRDYDEAAGHIIENRARPGNTGPLQRSKKDLDAISTAAVEVARLKARRAKLIEGGVSTKAPSIEKIDARVEELQAAIDAATIPAAAKEDAAPAGKSQSRPSGVADWTPGGRKLNAQAVQMHRELGRLGFGAAHNSPVKHEGKFDWRKHLGKGEGNWVYGAGTYLSTADGVHKFYKKLFSGAEHLAITDDRLYDDLQRARADLGPHAKAADIREWVRESLRDDLRGDDSFYDESIRDSLRELAKLSDSQLLGTVSPTYQVSVDIPSDRILAWAQPLADQPASIRLRALKAIKDLKIDGDLTLRGEDLYREIADKLKPGVPFEKSAPAASDYLQSLGILGHQYPSAKRNTAEPNYVIYDDSKITTNFVAFNRQDQGLNATPQEINEARLWLAKVLPDVRLEFKELTGHSGEWLEAQNLIEIATAAGPGVLQTTYHEALHAFFSKFVKSDERVLSVMKSLAEDPKVLERLQALLKDHPDAVAQLTSGEERLAYAYQFWAADLLDLPGGPARTLFQKIQRFFRRVLGRITDQERAMNLLGAFHEGRLANPSTAGQVIAEALDEGTFTLRAARKVDALVAKIQSTIMPAHSILGTSNSATARTIATMMWTNPGEEADGDKGEGYLNAKMAAATKYKNLFNDTIKGLSDRDLDEVAKHLQKETPFDQIAYAPQRAAAEKIDALLKRFHKYMVEERGTPIGKIVGENNRYFPRVYDVGVLSQKQGEFVDMLLKEYDDVLTEGVRTSSLTKQQVAERIHSKLMTNTLGQHMLPERDDGVLAPFFANAQVRELKWLKPEHAEPYLSKDLVGTLTGYFHGGARLAEYSHRFSADGSKLATMLKDVSSELNAAAMERFKKGEFEDEKAAKQWAKRREAQIHKAVGAMEGTLGRDIGSTWRNTSAWITVYQNVRLLPLTLFSSVVDPLGMVARGATMREAYDTFLRGAREVVQNWGDMFRSETPERQADEWEKLALAVGSVDAAMFSHHVADEYSSMYMSKKAKQVNDAFFRINGMEAWNRGTRVGATRAAVQFLERHAKLPDKVHSARWLKELGLTPADLTFDAEGNLITHKRELAVAKGISVEQAEREMEKVHSALRRWVQGAVLTPNSAQRPSWSSDPHYSMFFHLKQFSYSFHQTLVKRAVNELDHGNLAPLASFAWYIPVMMASNITRGLIQGGGDLPTHMQGMNLGDHMMRAASQTIAGVGAIGIDAQSDLFSLAGPAVEQVIDGFGQPIGKTITDALPAKSLYAEALR